MFALILTQAKTAIDEIMVQKIFGAAGNRIVIEECLQGPEVSVLAVCDGKHFLVLPTAQDHKRIFDDDLGPNTGGMGRFLRVLWSRSRFWIRSSPGSLNRPSAACIRKAILLKAFFLRD